jgi:sugar (pentulose or hexulose) kinase
LAGIGTGIFQDFDIATKILKTEKEIIPNALNKETYANRYQDYLNLNKNTAQISHSIARGK